MEPRALPVSVSPRRTVAVASVIIIICVASAAWWAWRSVSLELTAMYEEGSRKAGLLEECGHHLGARGHVSRTGRRA
jgi:hypothetical protein